MKHVRRILVLLAVLFFSYLFLPSASADHETQAKSVTAISTGPTTADVSFVMDADYLGYGALYSSYTATSSPGGVQASITQASISGSGSGTISISGLTPGIQYTFTVTTFWEYDPDLWFGPNPGTTISSASNAIQTQGAAVVQLAEQPTPPSPSYLVIKESPKISLSDISTICRAGEYLFMRSGAFEEKSVITERVFSLLRDSTIITTLTVTETNQASFDKSTIAGTYTCSEQVRQESSLAISLSSSKLTQLDAAKRAYKADLKKNAQVRPSRDNASREIYLDARRAVSEQAGKSRAELISGSSDFSSKLRDISLTYSEQVSSARDDFRTALSESYIAFEAANKKSLSDYFQALESAGISILVEAP